MNRLRQFSLFLLGLLALTLTGCAEGNLFDWLQNPFGYGCCALIILILDVLAIIEIVGNDWSGLKKILWILLIIFLPVLGCILYYVFAR